MSLCAICGTQLLGSELLCGAHLSSMSDWAADNRKMCDLIHRGRLPAADAPAPGNERAKLSDLPVAA